MGVEGSANLCVDTEVPGTGASDQALLQPSSPVSPFFFLSI